MGCLHYLTCTTPDILFGVGLISQQRGFFILLKELQAMNYFIHPHKILKLQVTLTVTGKKLGRQKKHNWIYNFYGRNSFHMDIKETIYCCIIHMWSRIHCCCIVCLSCNIAKETDKRFATKIKQGYTNLCW